jgi:hypothetical protein
MKKGAVYLVMLAMLFCGLLLLYRYSLASNDLTRIDGRILSKKREVVSSRKGSSRYGLIFEIENAEDKYGIYIGTANHIENTNDLFRLIDTGKNYTLLVDPSVSSSNGVKLGIREIYFNGERIFKASQRFDLFLGSFITILSLAGLILVVRADRKRVNKMK